MPRRMPQMGRWAALAALLSLAAPPTLRAQEGTNIYTTARDVASGEGLFDRHCSRCHGIGATGGERGPDLTGGFQRASTDGGLFVVIRDGVPNTEMRGIARSQSDQMVWQIVAYLRSLTGGVRVEVPGDARSGAQVYTRASCADCHAIDGSGGLDGPDLSTVGSRRSPDELMSDLTEPDERVQPEWWSMRVTHRDGTRVEGRRMGEGTFTVRILDDEGRMWSFRKRDLTASERIETSRMPSSAGTLSEQELQDLVAYLYGLTRN
ncbi:MAG TPA: c-type cytochrome [Longimicrobiales bacterium]|nr:c-type cytochrome [Longimicrobiales bacterium]